MEQAGMEQASIDQSVSTTGGGASEMRGSGAAWGTAARRIAFGALLLFAVIAPLVPTNEQKIPATLLAGILLIPACYVALRTGRPIGRTPLDAPALTFLGIASLATVFSVNPLLSLIPSILRGDGLLVYIAYVALALAAARLRRGEALALLTFILAGGALIAAVAVAQYYGVYPTRHLGDGRIMARSWGTLGNPIFMGGYVSLVLPIGLALAAQAAKRTWWGYAAACTLLYAALVGSETRAAWGASAGAAVLLVWLLPRTPRVYPRLAVLAGVFAAVTLVMMLTRPNVPLAARAGSTLDPQDSSLAGRLYIWRHTLPLIAERPVFGWGFSTLFGKLPGVGSREYRRVFGNRLLVIDATHNELLNIAYSTGLAGLAAYLWVWGTVFWGLAASPAAADGLCLGPGLIAGLAAYFVWLQLAWSHIGIANVFWAMAGIAVALTRPVSCQDNRIAPPPTSS